MPVEELRLLSQNKGQYITCDNNKSQRISIFAPVSKSQLPQVVLERAGDTCKQNGFVTEEES